MSEKPLALLQPARRYIVAGSGGSSAAAPRDIADNYRSKSYFLAIDLLSEGPIVGPVDSSGAVITNPSLFGKAIYFNKVPLLTDAGTFTIGNSTLQNPHLQNQMDNPKYADLDIAFTLGTQNQAYMDKFPSAEEVLTPNSGAISSITDNTGAVVPDLQPTIEIDNSDADTIEVGIEIQALFRQNKTTGEVDGAGVTWTIDISLNGGAFGNSVTVTKDRKITSPAIVASLILLPKSNTPDTDFWIVRVTKNTGDSTTSDLQNTIALSYIRVSENIKLNYPNCAMVYMKLDSANVSTIPTRGYRLKGMMVRVPNNYFPNKIGGPTMYSRNYLDGSDTGAEQIWNGGFYLAWTDNPAWVIFDLMTNSRYGLGNYIADGQVDKWTLYQIAQYCDQLVPDMVTKGNTERIFRCNVYLQTQQDAFQLLQSLATIFMGALYWGSGTLNFVQDSPVTNDQIVYTFTNANVQAGQFEYSSSAATTRHTVCNVQWNDPTDFYAPKYETYQDVEGIQRYGIRTLQLPALGCTTRGQAYRMARLLLWTEINATAVVNFTAGYEGAYLRPNDVIKVMDNDYTALSNGGRIVSISEDRLTLNLDRGLGDNAQQGTLSFIRPSAFATTQNLTSSSQIGSIRATQLLQVNYLVSQEASQHGIVVLADPLDASVVVGAIWIFEGNIEAQLFRVMGVVEKAKNEYQVTCTQYSNAKYDFVLEEHVAKPPKITKLANPKNVLPPQNLWVEAGYINQPEGVEKVLFVHWKKPKDDSIRCFHVEVKVGRRAFKTLSDDCVDETYEYRYTAANTYTFRITSLNALGRRSLSSTVSFAAKKANPLAAFSITGLEVHDASNDPSLTGKEADFDWNVTSPVGTLDQGEQDPSDISETAVPADDPMLDHFDLEIFRPDGQSIWKVPGHKLHHYKFTADMNARAKAPSELVPTGPYRTYTFQVTGFDKVGNPTTPSSVTVSKAQISKITGITVTNYFSTVSFNIPAPTDLDFKGILLYQSLENGFVPSADNLVYSGPSTSVSAIQAAGTTYYYVVAAHDSIDKNGLEYSDQITVTNNFLSEDDFTADLRNQLGITAAQAAGAYTSTTDAITGNSALATQINAVYAIVGQNSASVTQQFNTLTNNLGTLANYTTTLEAAYNGGVAALQQDLTTLVNPGWAEAAYVTTLGTLLKGHQASIQTNEESIAGIEALYSVVIDVNGNISGFSLTSIAVAGGGATSVFKIEANKLVFTDGLNNFQPFSATGGTFTLNVPLRSGDYVSGLDGFVIKDNGNAQFGTIYLRDPIHYRSMGGPGIDPAPGTVNAGTTLNVVVPLLGAIIRFTKDSSEVSPLSLEWPTDAGGNYTSLVINEDVTLRLRAYSASGLMSSSEVVAVYTISAAGGVTPKCAAPTIHNQNIYPNPGSIVIRSATAGSTTTVNLILANGSSSTFTYAGTFNLPVGAHIIATSTAPAYRDSVEVHYFNLDPTLGT